MPHPDQRGASDLQMVARKLASFHHSPAELTAPGWKAVHREAQGQPCTSRTADPCAAPRESDLEAARVVIERSSVVVGMQTLNFGEIGQLVVQLPLNIEVSCR
jgi:hypothetical protein